MIIKGARGPMVRWEIFLSTVVRNTIKIKGKRQGEIEGEEDLKRMKNKRNNLSRRC